MSDAPDTLPAPAATPTPVVEIEDASVALGGRPVLHGVTLRIDPGEIVAVLGPNGSGKSTLVRTLLGLNPLSSGAVRLFGTPLPAFRGWHRVGYVPQRLGAGSGVPATVREVVASGRLARRGFFRRLSTADQRAVTEALDAVGLAERAGEPVGTLSGGQQQRVLIARALTTEPDLLILDEPTSGVDAASQDAFAAVLARLAERGVTTVLVAHELGPLEPLVNRAVVLAAGQVIRVGPPHTVHVTPQEHDHIHPHAPNGSPSIWTQR